jgi:hypothetical protein
MNPGEWFVPDIGPCSGASCPLKASWTSTVHPKRGVPNEHRAVRTLRGIRGGRHHRTPANMGETTDAYSPCFQGFSPVFAGFRQTLTSRGERLGLAF